MNNYIKKQTTITVEDLENVDSEMTPTEALTELKEMEDPAAKYYQGWTDLLIDIGILGDGSEAKENRDFSDPDYKRGYDDGKAFNERQQCVEARWQMIREWHEAHDK